MMERCCDNLKKERRHLGYFEKKNGLLNKKRMKKVIIKSATALFIKIKKMGY
jgi:hypothetical protein